MLCQTDYSDLMSLKLDGTLEPRDEQRLTEHIASCDDCRLLWAAMQQADEILCASALEPLPAPVTLHATVMMRIAAPARAAQEAPPVLVPVAPGTPLEPVGPATRRLAALPTGALPAYVLELQSRLASYARSAFAIALAVAGTIGLALAALVSGIIPLSGPTGEVVKVARTFFEAAGDWLTTTLSGTAALWGVAGLLAGVLVLVAWQVVATYQRAAAEVRGATGLLVERGNTGLLVEAARP